MTREIINDLRQQIAQRLADFEGSDEPVKAHVDEADEILAMVAEANARSIETAGQGGSNGIRA